MNNLPAILEKPNKEVLIDYTNWEGAQRVWRVKPLGLHWGISQHHPTPQFILTAIDVESGVTWEFAMSGIRSWVPAAPPEMPSIMTVHDPYRGGRVKIAETPETPAGADLQSLWPSVATKDKS